MQVFPTFVCPMPRKAHKLLSLSYTHTPLHTHRVKTLIFTFILKYCLVLSYLPDFTGNHLLKLHVLSSQGLDLWPFSVTFSDHLRASCCYQEPRLQVPRLTLRVPFNTSMLILPLYPKPQSKKPLPNRMFCKAKTCILFSASVYRARKYILCLFNAIES